MSSIIIQRFSTINPPKKLGAKKSIKKNDIKIQMFESHQKSLEFSSQKSTLGNG